MRRRYGWTPEVERLILSYIRSGGYPWVAAESAGIPRKVFARWIRRGAKPGCRSQYRRLYENVIQAQAQARLGAEVETRKHDPRYWLTHGPGRERPSLPGWANPPPGRSSKIKEPIAGVLGKEFLQILDPILQALAPFPEAREAVARELEVIGKAGRAQGSRAKGK
jgi:hypothetical protein